MPRLTAGVSARTVAAVAGGRLAAGASRRLGRGGGTALPGLLAERVDPKLVRRLTAQLGQGSIVITGTNGKTTTTRILADIVRASGRRAVTNRSGSNLMRGLAAALVAESDLAGGMRAGAGALGIFEVDEATLLQAAPQICPRAVVFTNLFRDQLDRYGEVDSILAVWRRALAALGPDAVAVLNADDPSVAGLAAAFRGRSLFFGVEDRRQAAEAEHAADSRWCATCGSEYHYDALYFGHIGLWSCPGCGASRPRPEVSAESVELHERDRTHLDVRTNDGLLSLTVWLGGLYNAYNVLAAVAGAVVLGLSPTAIRSGVETFRAAFGRQERLLIAGRAVQVLLCKNPAGVNQVLRTLISEPGERYLLLLLNDDIADGRDVSWIWDVDFELLADRTRLAVASGRRGSDLALRLKYAGLGDRLFLDENPHRALARALAATPEGNCLHVLPTYTAMLAVREELARLGGRGHYWEQ